MSEHDSADKYAADELTRSSRDRAELQTRVRAWLDEKVDATVEVGEVTSPEGSGMSSETLLFDATWDGTTHALVARVEPDTADVPVFPTYDLELQYRVMELVGDRSDVPVPRTRWYESDPTPLGAPFFVMDRMTGRVPADIPPYLMDGWLSAATPAEQRALQDASVKILADLHGISIEGLDTAFLDTPAAGPTPLARHVENQRAYYEWSRNGRTHPIVERAFEWLDANWPADEGPTVISWGDSRIGNIMYAADGFEPVAAFDWEMAALAPQEMDLAWMMFMHTFFQEIANVLEIPGMPDFLRRDDVIETYESLSGRKVQNLEWFEVYAALRHAMIMARVTERTVHFGQAEWPDDLDSVIPHRHVLEQMLDGSWWS
ncbi:MAG: phosphotransferase family protein [Acidimicrobiales bacterium]